MSAETIGMAQKGGSVFSFLRLGDDIYCPMFPEKTADIIIGFEPAEAVRMLPYLRDGGQVVVNTHPIMPVTATLSGSDYTGKEMTEYLQRNVKQRRKMKLIAEGWSYDLKKVEKFTGTDPGTLSVTAGAKQSAGSSE